MPQLPNFIDDPNFALPSVPLDAAALVPTAVAHAAGVVGADASDFAQAAIAQRQASQVATGVTTVYPQIQSLALQQSLVPDHVKATQDFLSLSGNAIENYTNTIADPQVRLRTDTDLKMRAAAMADTVSTRSFGLERDTQRAQLEQSMTDFSQQAAQAGDNQQLRDNISATFLHQVNTAQDSHLIDPTEAVSYGQRFTSGVVRAQVEQQRNALEQSRDPMGMQALAIKVNDPTQFPGLLLPDREFLGQRLENLANTYIQTANSQAMRASEEAERALHRQQDATTTQILASIYNGTSFSTSQVLDLANKGMLSPSGVEAVHAATVQGQEGHDDPMAVFHLYDQLGQGENVSQSVGTALGAGQLSTRTAVGLMDANRATQDRTFTSATAKAGYDQLMTSLGADKLKTGFYTDANVPVLIGQAQGEYMNRVNVLRQDPQAVVADMLPRYIKTAPTMGALPNPRYGAITKPEEIGPVWNLTKQALQNGQLTPAQYDAEGQLLNQYTDLFKKKAAAAAAIQAAGKPGISVQPSDPSP